MPMVRSILRFQTFTWIIVAAMVPSRRAPADNFMALEKGDWGDSCTWNCHDDPLDSTSPCTGVVPCFVGPFRPVPGSGDV